MVSPFSLVKRMLSRPLRDGINSSLGPKALSWDNQGRARFARQFPGADRTSGKKGSGPTNRRESDSVSSTALRPASRPAHPPHRDSTLPGGWRIQPGSHPIGIQRLHQLGQPIRSRVLPLVSCSNWPTRGLTSSFLPSDKASDASSNPALLMTPRQPASACLEPSPPGVQQMLRHWLALRMAG